MPCGDGAGGEWSSAGSPAPAGLCSGGLAPLSLGSWHGCVSPAPGLGSYRLRPDSLWGSATPGPALSEVLPSQLASQPPLSCCPRPVQVSRPSHVQLLEGVVGCVEGGLSKASLLLSSVWVNSGWGSGGAPSPSSSPRSGPLAPALPALPSAAPGRGPSHELGGLPWPKGRQTGTLLQPWGWACLLVRLPTGLEWPWFLGLSWEAPPYLKSD